MENLEILLITFNRAALLDRTLNQFSSSPFAKCRFTVLDNCSTDNTPIVCEKYKPLFSNLQIIRHKKNLGASANLMRAVELADAEYTWLVMDDDVYDFTRMEDLHEELQKKEADLIVLGSWNNIAALQGKHLSTQKMAIDYKMYFSIVLFASSTIYRTSEFDASTIREAYRYSDNLFNHFPFYYKMLRQNKKVYVTKNQIISSGGNDLHGFTNFDLALAHMHICQNIQEPALRKSSINELVFTRGFFSLAGHIINARALYGHSMIFFKQKVNKLLLVFIGLGFMHKMAFITGMLAYLLPLRICRFLVRKLDKNYASIVKKDNLTHEKQLQRAKEL